VFSEQLVWRCSLRIAIASGLCSSRDLGEGGREVASESMRDGLESWMHLDLCTLLRSMSSSDLRPRDPASCCELGECERSGHLC